MLNLAGIRRGLGVTQTDLAARMGTIQTRISQIERANDLHFSTVAAYLSALGLDGELVVTGPGIEPTALPVTAPTMAAAS